MNPGDIPDHTIYRRLSELEEENDRLRIGIKKHKIQSINQQRRDQDTVLWRLLDD